MTKCELQITNVREISLFCYAFLDRPISEYRIFKSPNICIVSALKILYRSGSSCGVVVVLCVCVCLAGVVAMVWWCCGDGVVVVLVVLAVLRWCGVGGVPEHSWTDRLPITASVRLLVALLRRRCGVVTATLC